MSAFAPTTATFTFALNAQSVVMESARDRSGPGPWYNVKHQLIASNLADLHGDQQRDRNNIRRETVLDIKGETIPGNQHDILTGSDPDGRAFIDGYDHTCNNWTTDPMSYPQANPNVPADRARAMLGHSDRGGQNTSWITSHLSQGQQVGTHQHRRRRSPLLLRQQLKGVTLDHQPNVATSETLFDHHHFSG